MPDRQRLKFVALLTLAILLPLSFLVFRFYISPNAPGFGAFQDFNVVLISIDTLRADHLPAYGYKEVRTPAIDEVAQSGFVFLNTTAHVPLTLPSHTSIFTGVLPITHGVHDNANFLVDPKETTLAEVLKTKGYTTAAFVSAFVLDSRWRLDQGFDFYFDDLDVSDHQESTIADIQRKAGDTQLEVDAWLEQHHKKKFFMWVHYYDPHHPYDPPAPYNTEYQGNLYDGEIAYTDEIIGRLLRKLDQLDLRKRTIIVITADHGEGLGEHRESGHGIFVYGETIRVPLLISIPGSSHRPVPELVRHIDIAPTLLEWLGVHPNPEMQGKSLIPLLQGQERQPRTAFAESLYAELHYSWSPLQSLVSDEYRYIEAPRPELYDLKSDPREMNNLFEEKPFIARAMKTQLQDVVAGYTRKNNDGPQKMDAEVEEKLRALGYIGGASPVVSDGPKPDPKDKIHLAVAVSNAFDAMTRKNSLQAVQFIAPVLKEDPNVMEAHFVAGVAYADLQQYDKAIDELLQTIRWRPNHIAAMHNLAYAYQLSGKLVEAEEWYLQILKQDPDHLPAAMKLAQLYLVFNQPEKAHPYYLQAVNSYQALLQKAIHPEVRAGHLSALAELHFNANQPVLARKDLMEAIQLAPSKPILHYNLAQVLEAMGETTKATEAYEEERKIDPFNFRAIHNLGLLYLQMKQYEKAVSCFEDLLRVQGQNIQAAYFLARSYYLANRNLNDARQLATLVVKSAPEFQQGHILAQAIEKRLRQQN